MKKLITLCLVLILALSLAVPAAADIVYTPMDDFYLSHAEECKVIDRRYVPAEGSVAQKSPTNAQKAFELENIEYNVNLTYTDSDGRVWGCVEKDNSYRDPSGWIPLDCMSLVYDDESFDAEFGKSFVPAENLAPDLSGGAVIYEYPASPHKWVYGSGTDFKGVSFSDTWVDANGVTWARIPYHYGIRGWICVDNPLAGHDIADNTGSEGIVLDAGAAEIQGLHKSGEMILAETDSPEPHRPDKNLKPLWIALAATAAVAAAAVVCAAVFVKKKKAK